MGEDGLAVSGASTTILDAGSPPALSLLPRGTGMLALMDGPCWVVPNHGERLVKPENLATVRLLQYKTWTPAVKKSYYRR